VTVPAGDGRGHWRRRRRDRRWRDARPGAIPAAARRAPVPARTAGTCKLPAATRPPATAWLAARPGAACVRPAAGTGNLDFFFKCQSKNTIRHVGSEAGLLATFLTVTVFRIVMVLLDFPSTAQNLKCGVAVRIILNKAFRIAFSEVASSQILNSRLQQDICTALCIPITVVNVILMCFQQGNLMAEVILRESDAQRGSDISTLAELLVCKVKDSQSTLHDTPLGKFADDAEIHGIISLSVCESVMESQQQMLEQVRMKRSKVKMQLDALLQIMARKIGTALVARTFGAWIEKNYRSRCIYQSGMKVLLRWRRVSASGVFQAWCTQTCDKRNFQDSFCFAEYRYELISSCIVARNNKTALKASWSMWFEEHSEQQRMEKAAFRIIFRHQDRALRGSLITWLAYFMKNRRLSSTAKKIRHNTMDALCSRFISSWAELRRKKGQLCRRVCFFLGRIQSSIAKAFLCSWFQQIVEKAGMSRASIRVSSRSRYMLKYFFFFNWARGTTVKNSVLLSLTHMSIDSLVEALADPRTKPRKMEIVVYLLIKHICRCYAFESCELMFWTWKTQVLRIGKLHLMYNTVS
jgi:hypothetical protein